MQQSDLMARRVLGVFILALVFYAGAFGLDQWLRVRRGPWRVAFVREPSGDAAIVVNQPKLGIVDCRILFPGEAVTNEPVVVLLDKPRRAVPFGQVKYDDLTYLPGVVTLQLFGHEIEFLPRVIYVNRRPIPWRSATNLVLREADRPAVLPEPKPRKRSAWR